LNRIRRKIEKDPASKNYTDLALSPAGVELDDDLELYNATDSARAAANGASARARRQIESKRVAELAAPRENPSLV
ncbi:MAG TPA: hypothetical protein VEF03_08955, partial [Candidatus Binataceae bacterium]|nr:hypothetical protein [Candidatus Binataceae bacterium]